MGVLRLFRGDSSGIDEFNVKKTNKHSLLGQGIYLTTNLNIAKSYKVKGLAPGLGGQLFAGEAKDRADAYSKARPTFFNVYCYLNGFDRYKEENNKSIINKADALFQTLIDNKTITSKYVNYVGPVPYLIVSIDQDYVDRGHISTFDFDQEEFEPKIIKVDGYNTNALFWETMWKHEIQFGAPGCFSESDFVERSSRMNINLLTVQKEWDKSTVKFLFAKTVKQKSKIKCHKSTFDHIRRVMEPHGIRGLEYEGGRYMGGGIRHRAFCMWDADYVNMNRVT